MAKVQISNHLIGKSYFQVREFNNLREMLKQSTARFADEYAFKYRIHPDAPIRSKTYSDFDMDVDAVGTALCALGFKDKRIAIIGDNSYHWAVTYMAVVNGAGTVVPLDKLLPENEILGLLDRSKVSAVFYHPNFQSTMDNYMKTEPRIEKFVSMSFDEEKISTENLFTNMSAVMQYGYDLLAQNIRTFVDAPIDPETANILLYTSGTTSQSKAVMLCHRNICTDLRGFNSFITLGPGDILLSILPLHHTFENTCGLLTPLLSGACVAYCDGLRYITKNLKEYGISYIIGVPMLYENIYDKIIETVKKTKKYIPFRIALVLSKVLRFFGIDMRRKLFAGILEPLGGKLRTFISGAAPLSDRVAKGFEGIGINVFQGYGLTETSPVIAGCNEHVLVHGTCGHPIGGVEVIVDSERPGIPGEILVKGPIVMLGYLDNQEATDEAIVDGWFYTGDLGVIEKHGLLKITGRLKSMIVLNSGKKIFPEEIEALINKLPFIKESMVFAEPKTDGDAEVYVRLVLNKDVVEKDISKAFDDKIVSEILGIEIKSINKQMPAFKSIKGFLFGYEEMPKTTTLKIKRHIEMEDIKKTLSHATFTVKGAAGKNIDTIKKMLEERKKQNKKK
ncbi:MAG: AMP-binding protein [Clostridia bacterium]